MMLDRADIEEKALQPLLSDQLAKAQDMLREMLYWLDRARNEGIASLDCHAFRRDRKRAADICAYQSGWAETFD